MSDARTPAPNPYAVSLAALEEETRVPPEEQVIEVSHDPTSSTAGLWDEQRRQAQLAGGA